MSLPLSIPIFYLLHALPTYLDSVESHRENFILLGKPLLTLTLTIQTPINNAPILQTLLVSEPAGEDLNRTWRPVEDLGQI